jgi:Ca-activated chloride channel family protein
VDVLATFRHPWVLFLMVIPAALVLWNWRRRGRALVLPVDHAQGARNSGVRYLLRLAECLPAVVLALALFVLAGPQSWAEPRSKRALTNIQFCVDVSGSMTAKFGSGDRYEAAMVAINTFLDRREGDAFGLTFFGNSVLHWVPLTNDVSAFRCAPPFMHPRNLPRWFQGTMIGKALRACRKVLVEREEGDRMIILVSDGESFDLSGADEEIARNCAPPTSSSTVHIADGAIPEPSCASRPTGGEAFKRGQGGCPRLRAHRRCEDAGEVAPGGRPPAWCLAGWPCSGSLLRVRAEGTRGERSLRSASGHRVCPRACGVKHSRRVRRSPGLAFGRAPAHLGARCAGLRVPALARRVGPRRCSTSSRALPTGIAASAARVQHVLLGSTSARACASSTPARTRSRAACSALAT